MKINVAKPKMKPIRLPQVEAVFLNPENIPLKMCSKEGKMDTSTTSTKKEDEVPRVK